MQREHIFLTTHEAVEAICIDFRQYAPQTMLFSEVIRLITGNRIHIKRAPGKDGAWINRLAKTTMRWLNGPELVDHMCQLVRKAKWDLQMLSAVCSRVFQTHAAPACDIASKAEGVCIDTNLETYRCRQCGVCCQTLDYHNDVTCEDVARWNAQGRIDILKWVETRPRKEQTARYRIWVDPETGQLAKTCPFLRKNATTHRLQCGIHDAKPSICRQYPVSRKHATLTGCTGFDSKVP